MITVNKNGWSYKINTDNVIASYGISNCGGIAIYYADDDITIAGYNDDRPKAYKNHILPSGDVYFNFGRMRISLSDCIKVNRF